MIADAGSEPDFMNAVTTYRIEGGLTEEKERKLKALFRRGFLRSGIPLEELDAYTDRVWELMLEQAEEVDGDTLLYFTPRQTTRALEELDIQPEWGRH